MIAAVAFSVTMTLTGIVGERPVLLAALATADIILGVNSLPFLFEVVN